MNARANQREEDRILIKGIQYKETLELIAKLDPDGISGRFAKSALTGKVIEPTN